jgi:hypothetical protein
MSEERFDRIETRLDRIEGEVAATRQEMHELNTETREMIEKLDGDLRRHMGVLHEDLVSRIAALAPDFAPIRREFREGDVRLREELSQRIQPLEAFAREETRRRRGRSC